jgi:hypothetical protein
MRVGTAPCIVADGTWSMAAAEGRGQQGCRVICLMVYVCVLVVEGLLGFSGIGRDACQNPGYGLRHGAC